VRTLWLAAVILSATWLLGQDSKIEEVGKTPVAAKFAPGGNIKLDLCPSGIDLIGKDEGELRVSYDRNAPVRVRIEVRGNEAGIKVSDCPRNNFRVTIEVPKSSGLYVRMFAGELNIRDVTGDKDVELHFGQLTIEVARAEEYGRVDASVNSGALEASAFQVSKGGLFRSFSHNGLGKYRLRAHVGAGELDLR
jgi:hypothetical protein